MPAPILRHYKVNTVANTHAILVPELPVARAFVIGKLSCQVSGDHTEPALWVHLWVNPAATPTAAPQLLASFPLSRGEQLTETGLVIPANNVLAVAASAGGPTGAFVVGLLCTAFGEEVDN